ncbi:Uncharacterised protein [Streptococcus pneumoniae]|nr:Uncharacterised protein [Streptococcus pneumoniae]VTG73499.1 Uncharacterised protein [Streptococcus pneumoniae]
MVVYIRQSKLPSEVSINKYNAQVGAYLQGEEVILYPKSFIPLSTRCNLQNP